MFVRSRWLVVLGFVLVTLGIIGFATVADDLRHKGEIWGTASLLSAGLCLLLEGYGPDLFRRLALRWLALGLLVGIPVGAWLDKMPAGIAMCAAPGLALAYLRRR